LQCIQASGSVQTLNSIVDKILGEYILLKRSGLFRMAFAFCCGVLFTLYFMTPGSNGPEFRIRKEHKVDTPKWEISKKLTEVKDKLFTKVK